MLNNAISHLPDSPDASAPTPIKVWLVDDNRSIRNTMMEVLSLYGGVQCTGSYHSPNAVLSALASKAGPDVILLDIQMGAACGLDAIRPIKALSRSTQVLMFTTFFDSASEKRAMTSGASGFLLKHFPINKIVDSIHEASRNPAPHLRFTPGQNRAAGTALPAADSRRPQRPLLWLKNCLNKITLHRN